MQQLGWISRELCWVKKSVSGYLLYDSSYITFFVGFDGMPQAMHIFIFVIFSYSWQYYFILVSGAYIAVFQWQTYERWRRDFLFVLLSCTCKRCYHRGKWSEGYVGSLCYFIQLHINLQGSKTKQNKNKQNTNGPFNSREKGQKTKQCVTQSPTAYA